MFLGSTLSCSAAGSTDVYIFLCLTTDLRVISVICQSLSSSIGFGCGVISYITALFSNHCFNEMKNKHYLSA